MTTSLAKSRKHVAYGLVAFLVLGVGGAAAAVTVAAAHHSTTPTVSATAPTTAPVAGSTATTTPAPSTGTTATTAPTTAPTATAPTGTVTTPTHPSGTATVTAPVVAPPVTRTVTPTTVAPVAPAPAAKSYTVPNLVGTLVTTNSFPWTEHLGTCTVATGTAPAGGNGDPMVIVSQSPPAGTVVTNAIDPNVVADGMWNQITVNYEAWTGFVQAGQTTAANPCTGQ
jgi:hypothetical protein